MKTFKHLITAASAVVLATSVSIASADADPVGYFESELANPGGYTFKSGLAGKNGKDICYIGQFEACENPLSAVAVRTAESGRNVVRSGKLLLEKLRQRST